MSLLDWFTSPHKEVPSGRKAHYNLCQEFNKRWIAARAQRELDMKNGQPNAEAIEAFKTSTTQLIAWYDAEYRKLGVRP